MLFQYKKIIQCICLVIWSICVFGAGVTFGSPKTTVMQLTPMVNGSENVKKINEEVRIHSEIYGNIAYRVGEVSYTPNKQIIFHIELLEMKAFDYSVHVRDGQNQDIRVAIGDYYAEKNSTQFRFEIGEEILQSEVYVYVYPLSEKEDKTFKMDNRAYGKTAINIPSVRESTIERLK